MRAEYKRDLQNNYLVLQAPDAQAKDHYPIRMAEQNDVPGLLPFYSSQKDGLLYLNYEITSKQPLAGLYETSLMNSRDIVFLLSAVRDTAEQLHRYLLNPSQLVFDPDYIYVNAKKDKVFFCYLPGGGQEAGIEKLSEFILKRLEHEDKNAVALGYRFYQKASEANFSLHQTLKEILLETQGQEETEKSLNDYREAQARVMQGSVRTDRENGAIRKERGGRENGGIRKEWGGQENGGSGKERDVPENGIIRKERGSRKNSGGRDEKAEWENDGSIGEDQEGMDAYEVVHRKRKSIFERRVDRLFQIIHPAVFLSGLFCFAALEITFYFGLIGLTEAGGIFFLTVSVEMMINRWLLDRKDKEKGKERQWAEDEESEAYRLLQEETYFSGQKMEEIEETQYLGKTFDDSGIRLICVQSGQETLFPDICLEDAPVDVGKIPGEAGVILDSPTVSRLHARLEAADGKYYVKDMNSRNGTFCNGRRLDPQEKCEFKPGDRIRFAQVEYQAVMI